MELVRGVPITEYCDANNLSTPDRLQLFISVCHAVRHAHQKGVIHRDLKPSNVLVTLHDGVPVPKVIDFGIAKATGGRLTDKTLFTEFKQLMGTPEYMSPEQAEMSGLDVDTRADIYSLGVLLYELLTGTTPFDPKTLRRAAYDEILRIIREVEPERPSTRVSTLGERLAGITKHRRAESTGLSRLLLGDLDWIVMKALEKDRTRRYESADGLSQDVERHLHDEPVLASPPSAVYRMRKFARRNRAMLGALAGVAAALVLGLAAASWGWLRARSERDRALVAEHVASREAKRVEKVNGFLQRFLTAPGTPWALAPGGHADSFGPEVKVVDVVDEVVKSLDAELQGEPEIEADVRLAIGESYLGLSRYVDAEAQLRRAIELRRRISGGEDMPTMKGLVRLGAALTWQGRFEEARSCLLGAIEGCKQLVGERALETLAAENEYVMFLMDKEFEPEAVPRAKRVVELSREIRGAEAPETLAAQAALAFALNSAKRGSEGEALAQETFAAVQRTLGDRAGLYDFCLAVLGNSAMARSDPVEAERRYREMLERATRAGHGELFEGAVAASQLARALGDQGRWAEAEGLSRRASAAYLRNFGGAHPYTFSGFARLALALHEQGKDDEAERCYRDLVETCTRSHDAHHPVNRIDEAKRLLARHLLSMGKLAEAEPIARAVVERRREDWTAKQEDLRRAQDLGRALGTWGEILANLHRVEEADKAFREALEICDRSFDKEGEETLGALERFGLLLEGQERYGEAEGIFRRILEGRRRTLGEQHPNTLLALNNVAWILFRLGRAAEAEPLARAAVEGHRRLPNVTPASMTSVLDTLASVLKELGNLTEAESLFAEIEELEQRAPGSVRPIPEVMLHHAECLLALHRLEDAERRLLAAEKLLSAGRPSDAPVSRAVAGRLAELYTAWGREEDAAEWARRVDGK